MLARNWISVAGLIVIGAAIYFIRNSDDGYRQYYRGQILAAIPALERKAEQGEAYAAYLLGKVNLHQEYRVKAQEWFLKSARLGDLNGAVMYALTIHHRSKGAGIRESKKGHCIWYVKFLDMAARQGSVLAADLLGRYYARGECVSPRELESRYYFKLAIAMDRSFGVRLEGKKPLSVTDQEIIEKRLAIPNTTTTEAQVLAYFFSTLDKFK